MVGTFHANGDLGWMRFAKPMWGFLAERLDHRIAVSERARVSADRWLPGDYEIVPNGVLIPPAAEPADRQNHVVFAGRHEGRKGLQVLLRAWPSIRAQTGATLRICGADPLAVRLLMTRLRMAEEGVDVLGFLPQEDFTKELLSAKALVAPSLGGESFGIVLVRAMACATPVVASDIPGYRDVMTPETAVSFPAGDEDALATAVVALLADEPATAGDGRRRPAARAGALRVGGDRPPSARDLRGSRCMKLERLIERLPRSNATRFAISIVFMGVVAVLLWWRGPSFSAIGDAFTTVRWQWVAVAVGLNLASVVARAIAWRTVIRQAMPPPHPSNMLVFSAFSVGLFANAVLPGRIGELARVAVLSRKLPKRKGMWATLVGTVFAHRVFDLVPVVLLILYVAVAAKIPSWAVTSLVVFVGAGSLLFTFAFVSARRPHVTKVDHLGAARRIVTMARQGLGVMRSPLGTTIAILFQIAGWMCQLLAVWAAMRAFDIHSPLRCRRRRAAADERCDGVSALARQRRPHADCDRNAARQ